MRKGNWKGGRFVNRDGYILIYKPEHPFAHHNKFYVFEHRLVMEEKLGRYLKPNERVHHKNSVRNDNRIKNLELFSNNGKHLSKHFQKKISVNEIKEILNGRKLLLIELLREIVRTKKVTNQTARKMFYRNEKYFKIEKELCVPPKVFIGKKV